MQQPDPQGWLDEHGSALYAFAMLHLGDTHRSEDMVQETLLAALQSWHGFRGDCAVRTWLTGILKHKILDEFRRQERETPEVSSDAAAADAELDTDFVTDGHWRDKTSDWGNPDRCLDGERFWAAIERCVAGLTPRAARLFVLRELWEMETDQLCKELAISPSNLWTSLHRARLNMRRCLQRSGIGG